MGSTMSFEEIAMNYELMIKIGATEKKVFLQSGFFNSVNANSPVHKHCYAEVHIVSRGSVDFYLNNETLTIKAGHVFIIPPDTLHSAFRKEMDTSSISFMINAPVENIASSSISPDVLASLLKEIKECTKSDNFSAISAHIAFLCHTFFKTEHTQPSRIMDDALLIEEFFNMHYAENISLSDLAAELHRSEKQASRLVLKYTGNTFKRELCLRRVNAARLLSQTTDMSMAQIAECLGYTSYSSLWKACQSVTGKPPCR